MNYAITHQNQTFTPDGRIDLPVTDVDAYNQALESAEIERIKSDKPDHLFLYVKALESQPHASQRADVTTFLGTRLNNQTVILGPRVHFGFNRWTYKRSLSVRIFGVLYHGWYFESSGDYCRLKKAKRQ